MSESAVPENKVSVFYFLIFVEITVVGVILLLALVLYMWKVNQLHGALRRHLKGLLYHQNSQRAATSQSHNTDQESLSQSMTIDSLTYHEEAIISPGDISNSNSLEGEGMFSNFTLLSDPSSSPNPTVTSPRSSLFLFDDTHYEQLDTPFVNSSEKYQKGQKFVLHWIQTSDFSYHEGPTPFPSPKNEVNTDDVDSYQCQIEQM